MLRTYLFFLLITISKLSFAQISLDDLFQIQKSDVGTITNLLIDKNWQLIESSKETEDNYGEMKWAYGVNEFESEKANAWLNIDYSESAHNRVSMEAFNKLLYQKIKEKVISYGMKKVNYGLIDNYTFIDYAGVNYVVRIGIGSNSESNVSRYVFLVWNKKDYLTLDKED